MNRTRAMVVFGAAFLATIYPALLSLHAQGLAGVFSYLPGDAFYYLAIAEHSVGKAFFTFDGSFPTNGFHPLWGYYLRTAFELLGWQGDQARQLLFTFYSSAAFVATGTALFGLTLHRLTGRAVLSVLGVVPGAYYLLFATVDAHFGAPWAFVNGMESPLTILFGGVLAYALVAQNVWGRLTLLNVGAVSLMATLLTLSRLDDVFIFVPLLLAVGLYSRGGAPVYRRLLVAVLIPTILIGAYLLYNLATTGFLLPVSGLAKASGTYWRGTLAGNLAEVMRVLSPPRSGAWAGGTWRTLQLWVPPLVAGIWLAHRAAERPRPRPRGPMTSEAALSLLAGYVLVKGLYNAVNVGLWHQGNWYYPFSIFTTNLILAVLLHRALRPGSVRPSGRWALDHARLRPVVLGGLLVAGVGCVLVGASYLLGESQHPVLFGRYTVRRLLAGFGGLAAGAGLLFAMRVLAAAGSRLFTGRTLVRVNPQSVMPVLSFTLGLAFVLVVAHAFVDLKRTDDYGADNYAFWMQREAVAARLAAQGAEGGIIELDDGIVSYAMPASTMSGFGLALDKEGYQAWQQGELLAVAYERGHRLLGSVWYAQHWPDEVFSDSTALQSHMASLLWGQNTDGWTFALVDAERGDDFHYAFIRFAPTAPLERRPIP